MIVLYAAASFLYWIALYLYMPTLPTYAQSRTEEAVLVGLALSMYGLWQAIIRLPLGIAADWLGWRKPFLVGGFALAGLGAWVMGTASGIGGIALGRAITGLAAGTWVPLVVVFSSLVPPQEAVRAAAVLTLCGSVGRTLATGATGWLNEAGRSCGLGYSLAFFLAAGAAGLAIAIVLPSEERRLPRHQPSPAAVRQLVSRRDVLLPSLLSAVAQYANWATTFSFLPILASGLGATDIALSALASLNIAMVIIGNSLATTIANRVGTRRLVYVSFLLLSLGIAGAAVARTLAPLFAAQFAIGLSQGISYPVLMGMSIEQVDHAERNTAMGLHQAVYAVGMFAGPAVSGALLSAIGIRPMFGATAIVCLALGLGVTRRLGRPAPSTAGAAPMPPATRA
jgi:MFS family permease